MIWGFPARHGATPKMLVYFMENPTKADDNWGYPYDETETSIIDLSIQFKWTSCGVVTYILMGKYSWNNMLV